MFMAIWKSFSMPYNTWLPIQMIQYIGDIEFEAKVLLARIFSNLTKDEQDSLSLNIKVTMNTSGLILKYIDNYGIDSTKMNLTDVKQ